PLEVGEDAVAAHVNLATLLPSPEAEVDVLIAVHDGLVETAHCLERLSPNENAGRRDHLKRARLADCRVVSREARIDMPRDLLLGDDDSNMLNRVVRIEQLAAHDRRVRRSGGVVDQRIEPSGLREDRKSTRL